MSVMELKINKYRKKNFCLCSRKLLQFSTFEPLKTSHAQLIFIKNFNLSVVFGLQTLINNRCPTGRARSGSAHVI